MFFKIQSFIRSFSNIYLYTTPNNLFFLIYGIDDEMMKLKMKVCPYHVK